MKKAFTLLLILIVFAASCAQQPDQQEPEQMTQEEQAAPAAEEEPVEEASPEPTAVEETEMEEETPACEDEPGGEFKIFNPYQALSEEEMAALDAADFAGTDLEIAQQILAWQGEHMQYFGNPMEMPGVSHPMRWNYFMPGIFPVSDMIKERVTEDGKIYGLCWDYAAIYVAMAEYYGLECRVTAYKTHMSDLNPIFQGGAGMSEEEYEAILPRLHAAGLDLDYNHISRSARETWAHYRAEVKIDGEWMSFDGAPGVSEEYASLQYDLVAWDEGYDADLLYGEVEDLFDIQQVAEALADAPAEGYEGIVDDAGDPNRAATITDVFAGKGLVPYFDSVEELEAFVAQPGGGGYPGGFGELMEIMADYEQGTGKRFYALADMLIYTVDTMEAADYVPLYNAITGSNMTEAEFNDFVK